MSRLQRVCITNGFCVIAAAFSIHQAAVTAEEKGAAKAALRQLKQVQFQIAAPPVGPVGRTGEDPKKAGFTDAISFPTDRKAARILEAGADFIKEEAWGEAARLLQSLLDTPEDIFVEVERQGGKHWTSLKNEANRLLGTMPPQGKQFYELQFGVRAKGRLAEAKTKGDPQILGEVAQKYMHTEAGAEATNLLGTYHLDRGRYVMAALCYERLLMNQEHADKLSAVTLLKATLAFRRAGDQANADIAWKRFLQASRGGLRIGDQLVQTDQIQQELDRFSVPEGPASPFDWSMFMGNASRSAQGNGTAPFLDHKWVYSSTGLENQTAKWIEQAVQQQESRAQPILPSFFPIAVTVKTDKETKPLLIYRSHWGIHARDLSKDGKLSWDSPANWSLDRIAADSEKTMALNQWLSFYLQYHPQLMYENSTVGTLSTDNKKIYVVDDLVLPPHPQSQAMQQLQWGQPANFGKLDEAVRHNRLQAYELATNGKLVWELGGRKIGDKDDPLYDSYFLGPPLPVGDKLYVLNDKNSELRLICLDPPKDDKQPPSIHWIQSLVNLRDKMLLDVGRRMHAAHISYGEGILVCPTNAGAILGVDLLSHTLAWAHSYREDNYQPAEDIKKPRGGAVMPNYAKLNLDWKTSAPVIQEGKVVFTAPDATSVQCLNLRNGDLLWKQSRGDDLYLAGVYNGKVLLVGRNTCRALNLTDGKQLWKVETGMPSGQGVASGNIYFLPLKAGAASKEPEVCSVDIEKGVAVAHTKSRKKEVPGNLLFYEGDVISQTATQITAYRQLRIKLEEIDLALKKNPRDPAGLTERGELRLDDGRLEDAVADLRTALANNPPPDVRPKTRAKLFESLTEMFQRDFAASEKYLDEYREMCKVEIPAGITEPERRKLEEEQQRREGNLLCLVAKGREKQGRLGEAFDAYMQFGSLAGNRELVSVIDEPSIKARPDIWSQGRIAAMVSRATADQRKPLEDKIAEQWRTIRESKEVNALRRFVALFGSLFAIGREARMVLAERLIEENAFLEAELHLLQLRQQPDKQISARAIEGLARLMIRKGLLDDAAYWYRVLGHDFARTVVAHNKTGHDYLQDLATDKRLVGYLDAPRPSWAGAKWKAKEDYKNNTNVQQHVFEPEGEMLPFFQRHRLILLNNAQIKMVDRNTNEDRFNESIIRNNTFYNFYNTQYNNVRFPFFFKGHLVVVSLGHVVYAFDPVAGKKLWEKNLMGNALLPGANPQITQDRDGTLQVTYADGFVQKVGKTGPIEASYVCLNTRDGLVALDPLTGSVLWTKTDVPMRTQIFGDDQYVYLVEVRADGTCGAGKALRAHDGVAVEVPDFGPLYSRRIRTVGRHLLLSETEKDAVVVRLYDVHTGKDIWKKSFPAKAIVLKCEDPELAGAVDPKDGKVTVFNLHTQKEVLAATVDPKDLDKVQDIHFLNDNERFYLAIHRGADPGLNPWGGPWANVIYGMRCIPVNGKVYALEKDTGKFVWKVDAPNQMMIVDQFKDLPIMLFTARSQKPQNAGGINRGGVIQVAATLSFDKRTGKRIYDKEFQNQSNQFHALNVNLQAGTIELVCYNLKIVHYVDGTGGAKSSGAVPKESKESVPQAKEAPKKIP